MLTTTPINSIKAFIQATILQECLTWRINPLELTNFETGETYNDSGFSTLICQAEKQLINHHYLAFYLNRDEQAIELEPANSRLEFASLYEAEDIHLNSLDCLEGITSIFTTEAYDITYTIEVLEDV